MTRCETDHSIFYRHSSAGCVYFIVYVDNIIYTSSDNHGISQMKQHLCDQFQTKDLGKLKYFLDIEVVQSDKDGIVISQTVELVSLQPSWRVQRVFSLNPKQPSFYSCLGSSSCSLWSQVASCHRIVVGGLFCSRVRGWSSLFYSLWSLLFRSLLPFPFSNGILNFRISGRS